MAALIGLPDAQSFVENGGMYRVAVLSDARWSLGA